MPTSVSRIKAIIELKGKGSLECEFIRHIAPLTVGSIVRALPLEGRVIIDDKYIGLITNLTLGAEKQREEYRKGEMAYMLANNAICIFKKDSKIKGLNPIGRVINEDLSILEKAEMGDVISIRKA